MEKPFEFVCETVKKPQIPQLTTRFLEVLQTNFIDQNRASQRFWYYFEFVERVRKKMAKPTKRRCKITVLRGTLQFVIIMRQPPLYDWRA